MDRGNGPADLVVFSSHDLHNYLGTSPSLHAKRGDKLLLMSGRKKLLKGSIDNSILLKRTAHIYEEGYITYPGVR